MQQTPLILERAHIKFGGRIKHRWIWFVAERQFKPICKILNISIVSL